MPFVGVFVLNPFINDFKSLPDICKAQNVSQSIRTSRVPEYRIDACCWF